MAKKKKQKATAKSTPMLSPENYIKTRARKLPISECYITSNWEVTRMANVLVARKHVNGNRTFAVYLVDLNCLGIKNASYYFNMPEFEFNDILDHHNFNAHEPLVYELAHNIVYGAMEFAGEYGFKPHKDWSIAQYILEEDNDEVPLIDIAFGLDGRPYYMSGPYDSESRKREIIATLERTAGPGNYRFNLIDEDDFDVDDDDFDDDNFDEFDEEDTVFAPGDIEAIMKGEQKPTLYQFFLLLVTSYRVVRPDDEFISTETLNENLDIDEGFRTSYIKGEAEVDEIMQLIIRLQKYSNREQLKKLDGLIAKHGANPLFYTAAYAIKLEEGEVCQEDIVRLMDEQYPDFLEFRFLYAQLLIETGKLSEAWQRLGGTPTLAEAFPERNGYFGRVEWLLFNIGMAKYYLETGELNQAISYAAEVAYDCEEGNTMVTEFIVKLTSVVASVIKDEAGQEDN